MCLVQQLGSDLSTEVPLKLKWLRDALLVLNVDDPAVSQHIQDVLGGLQRNMQMVEQEYRDSQFTIVQHILRSMQKSNNV